MSGELVGSGPRSWIVSESLLIQGNALASVFDRAIHPPFYEPTVALTLQLQAHGGEAFRGVSLTVANEDQGRARRNRLVLVDDQDRWTEKLSAALAIRAMFSGASRPGR